MKWKGTVSDDDLLRENVEDFERHIIVSTLKRTNGNQSEAAKQLGTTKRIIGYRIRKYGIDMAQFKVKQQGGCSA